MRFFACLALLCASLGMSGAASAEATASYGENGRAMFSFSIPDFWTLESGGARELTPPEGGEARPVPQVISRQPTVDPTVWMGFLSPAGLSTLAQGRAYLAEISAFLGGSPQVSGATSRTIGGMPADIIRGTGRRDGRDLSFSIAVIDLPGSRIAIAAAVIEAGTGQPIVDEINRIFDSIRASR